MLHPVNMQNQLARRVPFCWATMLGSHNSGITLADGYGVLDPYFQKYFAWVKLVVRHCLLRHHLMRGGNLRNVYHSMISLVCDLFVYHAEEYDRHVCFALGMLCDGLSSVSFFVTRQEQNCRPARCSG